MKKHILISALCISLIFAAEACKPDDNMATTNEVTTTSQDVIIQIITTPPSVSESKTNYSGSYVDTQGTDSVYSELDITYHTDDSYKATIGLYRITTLEGIATLNGDTLSFEDPGWMVKGEISIQDTKAIFTVTESAFEYLKPGDVFEFPEKR